jgi:aspartyl-tRNA(Asn)/glutamyl-tRNA(Gln) amidotransferase subunit C
MPSRDEIKHIAKLARLDLKEEEIEKLNRDLNLILDYIKLLNEAKEDKEIELSENNFLSSFREDEVKEPDLEEKENIIKNFPDKEEKFIRVKKVFYD